MPGPRPASAPELSPKGPSTRGSILFPRPRVLSRSGNRDGGRGSGHRAYASRSASSGRLRASARLVYLPDPRAPKPSGKRAQPHASALRCFTNGRAVSGPSGAARQRGAGTGRTPRGGAHRQRAPRDRPRRAAHRTPGIPRSHTALGAGGSFPGAMLRCESWSGGSAWIASGGSGWSAATMRQSRRRVRRARIQRI